MASYPPPTTNAGIFDSSLFITDTGGGLSFEEAELYFLKFPNAQGTENMLDTNIAGDLDITGLISFNDNTEQTSAYTGAGALSGSYSLANLTIDTDGKITAVSNGSVGDVVTISGTQTITGAKTFSNTVVCDGSVTQNNELTTKSYVDTAISNIDYSSLVNVAGTQTITGLKTFSQPPLCSTSATTNTQLTNKSYVDGLIATTVKTTGAQTIEGIKTFSSIPVCSGGNAVNSNQLTTKSYVDTAISNIDYSDFVNLTGGQTITGAKNFTDIDIGDAFATSILYDDNSLQFSAYTGWTTSGTYTNPTISFGVDGDITNIEDGDLSKIDAIQSSSTATTLDVKDTIQIIEVATTTKNIITPTQLQHYNGTSTVSADMTDIIAVGNLNGTIPSLSANQTFTGEIDFDAQVTFNNLAPHCSVVPTFGNDLTNKDYVDGLISSSVVGGGLVTYLENDQSSGISTYKVLSTTFETHSSNTLTTTALGTNTIQSFITNANIPYIFNAGVVPAGLWNLAIYATASTNTGQLDIYFTINKYNTSTSTKTLIATSGLSSDINSASVSPDLYHCSATFPQTSFTANERILIDIISVGTGMGGGATITTYYEGDYYSYLTTSISSGAGIFSTNNTWTGNNTFSGTTNTFSNALTCSNSVATPTINNTTNSATLSIGESQTGIINIGSASNSANQNLNGTWKATSKLQTPIIEGTSSAIDIKANTKGHITQATTRTDIYDTNIYVGDLDNAGTITTAITNIGTNSFGKVGTSIVNLGSNANNGNEVNIKARTMNFGDSSTIINTNVNFNGYCAVDFAKVPTISANIPDADNSISIATTQFVKNQEYATLDNPQFTGSPTAPTQLTADDSTKIATTAFVKAQGYVSGGTYLPLTSATAITLSAPSYEFSLSSSDGITVNNELIAPYQDIYFPPTSTINLTPSATMGNNRVVYLTGGTYTLTDPAVAITATFIFQSATIDLVLSGTTPSFIDMVVGEIGDTFTSICANQTITITRYAQQAGAKWFITSQTPAWKLDSISDISVGSSSSYVLVGNTTAPSVINGNNITIGDTTNTIANTLNSANSIILDAPLLEVPNTINQTTSGQMNLFTNLGTNQLYVNNSGGTGRTHLGNATGGTRLYGEVFTSSTLSNIVTSNNNNIYATTTGAVSLGNVASTLNIGSGACGAINIGSSTQTGNTTIQANPTSGDIVIKNPLRIENTIAFTSFNQIGYFYGSFSATGYSNYTTGATNLKFPSTTSPVPVQLPIGTYMITCVISFNCSAGATAGVLNSLSSGYTLGTASTYNNTRQAIVFFESASPIFKSANTDRLASAVNYSWTAYVYNPSATNYIGLYTIVNISTAFVGGTIGANINSWQLTRIA